MNNMTIPKEIDPQNSVPIYELNDGIESNPQQILIDSTNEIAQREIRIAAARAEVNAEIVIGISERTAIRLSALEAVERAISLAAIYPRPMNFQINLGINQSNLEQQRREKRLVRQRKNMKELRQKLTLEEKSAIYRVETSKKKEKRRKEKEEKRVDK